MAVVKSKPKDLTVKEYIDILRKNIVAERRQGAQGSSSHRFDAAAYWHSQYQRLEGSLKAAQDETIDLKIEIEGLKDQLKESRPKTATRKRKQDEDVVRVERAVKRSKASTLSTQEPSIARTPDPNFDCSGLGSAGSDLMRSFYHVNSILNSYQKTDPDILAQRCIMAASIIPRVVCEASQNEAEANSKQRFSLKDILTAASRVILCLIMGLNRVTRLSDGADHQGKVIYAYVHMFAQVLDALSEIAAFQARIFTTSAPHRVQATLTLLTTFLCDIVEGLNSSMEAHQALFEGYAYVVLKRVGTSLHTSVFGHVRADSLEAEISIGGEKQATKHGVGQKATDESKAAEIEAPFLTRILQSTLIAAPAYLDEANRSRTGKAKTSKAAKASKSLLANGAKERLQRTLISCMFGSENGGQGDLTKDCLQMPVVQNSELVMPPEKDTRAPEWFTEEVWRLVGWEILSREAAE